MLRPSQLNIQELIDKLPEKKPCVAGGDRAATDYQVTLLSKLGFDLKDCSYLTKREASAMISVMYSGQTNPEWDKWVLPSGKFKGVHVSQIPYVYRNMLLTDYRFKNSNAAQLLRDWNKRRQG